jgi:hypothetical protein
MTDFQDLISPATVDLDVVGRALYSAMRQAEDAVTFELIERGAMIFQCGEVVERTDQAEGPRRKLAVVPPSALAAVHAEWPAMLASLTSSRADFQAYLDEHKDARTQGAGVRSTAPPTWIGHADQLADVQIAARVRYHRWQAFRAGRLTAAEVRLLIEKKIDSLSGYIVNASKARQHERSADYASRLKKVEDELRRFKAVDGKFLARVLSGQGLRFLVKWLDKSKTEFGVPHLTVIAGAEPEAAPHRDRQSKYGEPFLELEECRLMLFRVAGN